MVKSCFGSYFLVIFSVLAVLALTLIPTATPAAASPAIESAVVQSERPPVTPMDVINCIWSAESSRQLYPPAGDGGDSIGPLQIQRAYWSDAVERSGLKGEYRDCLKLPYAEKVVIAYWNRYAPKKATPEQLARIHNGGPKGHLKQSTKKYWAKDAFDPIRESAHSR